MSTRHLIRDDRHGFVEMVLFRLDVFSVCACACFVCSSLAVDPDPSSSLLLSLYHNDCNAVPARVPKPWYHLPRSCDCCGPVPRVRGKCRGGASTRCTCTVSDAGPVHERRTCWRGPIRRLCAPRRGPMGGRPYTPVRG